MTDSPQQPFGPRPPVETSHGIAPPPPPYYAPYPYPPAAPPAKQGFLPKVLKGALVSIFIMSILMNVYLLQIVVLLTGGMREAVYEQGTTRERIVIIPIEGVINDSMYDFVGGAIKQLRDNKEDMPKAIVLRIDSPGGSVGASDRILNDIRVFKKDFPGIPVLASFGGVAASGGYYVAAECDTIIAEPTCITGSIGVIATMMTIDKLMEKVGVTPTVLVADGSPRKEVANNMYRPLNAADQEKIKEILNTAYERFTQVVADGRKKVLTPEQVKAVATGDIYNTKQAIANKLIDGEGYLEDVLKQAKTMAKIAGEPRVTVINPARSFNPMSLLMGQSNAPSHSILEDGEKMRTYLQELRAPRVEYLWEPGM